MFHFLFSFVFSNTDALFIYWQKPRVYPSHTQATAMLLVYRRISITRINKRIHGHRWSCFLLILFFWFIRLCCCCCCFLLYSLNVRKLRSCARWNLMHLCVYFDQFKHKWCRSRAPQGAANICRAHSSSYTEIKRTTMERLKWLHQFNDRTIWKGKIPPFICTSLRLYIYIFLVE